MNKPAGKKKGFSLGSTAQSHTKGICTWCLPHPKKPNHTVVLLDTEGLGDVEKVISFWLKTRNSVNITWIEEESFDTGYVRSWMNLHNGAPCEELPQMVSRVRGLLRETRETVDPRTPIPSESGEYRARVRFRLGFIAQEWRGFPEAFPNALNSGWVLQLKSGRAFPNAPKGFRLQARSFPIILFFIFLFPPRYGEFSFS
ncbi:guanylate-binding protein 7-like isoform 1-T1 [Trichechus inunguis]